MGNVNLGGSKRQSYSPGDAKDATVPANGDVKAGANGQVECVNKNDATTDQNDVIAADDNSSNTPTSSVPATPTTSSPASPFSPTEKKTKRRVPKFVFSLKRTGSGKRSRKPRTEANGVRPVSYPAISAATDLATIEKTRPQSMIFEDITIPEDEGKIETVSLSSDDEHSKEKRKHSVDKASSPPPSSPKASTSKKEKKKEGSQKKKSSKKKKDKDKEGKSKTDKQKKGADDKEDTPQAEAQTPSQAVVEEAVTATVAKVEESLQKVTGKKPADGETTSVEATKTEMTQQAGDSKGQTVVVQEVMTVEMTRMIEQIPVSSTVQPDENEAAVPDNVEVKLEEARDTLQQAQQKETTEQEARPGEIKTQDVEPESEQEEAKSEAVKQEELKVKENTPEIPGTADKKQENDKVEENTPELAGIADKKQAEDKVEGNTPEMAGTADKIQAEDKVEENTSELAGTADKLSVEVEAGKDNAAVEEPIEMAIQSAVAAVAQHAQVPAEQESTPEGEQTEPALETASLPTSQTEGKADLQDTLQAESIVSNSLVEAVVKQSKEEIEPIVAEVKDINVGTGTGEEEEPDTANQQVKQNVEVDLSLSVTPTHQQTESEETTELESAVKAITEDTIISTDTTVPDSQEAETSSVGLNVIEGSVCKKEDADKTEVVEVVEETVMIQVQSSVEAVTTHSAEQSPLEQKETAAQPSFVSASVISENKTDDTEDSIQATEGDKKTDETKGSKQINVDMSANLAVKALAGAASEHEEPATEESLPAMSPAQLKALEKERKAAKKKEEKERARKEKEEKRKVKEQKKQEAREKKQKEKEERERKMRESREKAKVTAIADVKVRTKDTTQEVMEASGNVLAASAPSSPVNTETGREETSAMVSSTKQDFPKIDDQPQVQHEIETSALATIDGSTETVPCVETNNTESQLTGSPMPKETDNTESQVTSSPMDKETDNTESQVTSSPMDKETDNTESQVTSSPMDKETDNTESQVTSSPRDKETDNTESQVTSSPMDKETDNTESQVTSSPRDKETDNTESQVTGSPMTTAPENLVSPETDPRATPSVSESSSPSDSTASSPLSPNTPDSILSDPQSPESVLSSESAPTSPVSPETGETARSGALRKIELGPRLRTAILRKSSSGAEVVETTEKRVSLTQPHYVQATQLTPPPRKQRPRRPVEQVWTPLGDYASNPVRPSRTSSHREVSAMTESKASSSPVRPARASSHREVSATIVESMTESKASAPVELGPRQTQDRTKSRDTFTSVKTEVDIVQQQSVVISATNEPASTSSQDGPQSEMLNGKSAHGSVKEQLVASSASVIEAEKEHKVKTTLNFEALPDLSLSQKTGDEGDHTEKAHDDSDDYKVMADLPISGSRVSIHSDPSSPTIVSVASIILAGQMEAPDTVPVADTSHLVADPQTGDEDLTGQGVGERVEQVCEKMESDVHTEVYAAVPQSAADTGLEALAADLVSQANKDAQVEVVMMMSEEKSDEKPEAIEGETNVSVVSGGTIEGKANIIVPTEGGREETIVSNTDVENNTDETVVNTGNMEQKTEDVIATGESTISKTVGIVVNSENTDKSQKEDTDVTSGNIADKKEDTDVTSGNIVDKKEDIGVASENIVDKEEDTDVASGNIVDKREHIDVVSENSGLKKEHIVVTSEDIVRVYVQHKTIEQTLEVVCDKTDVSCDSSNERPTQEGRVQTQQYTVHCEAEMCVDNSGDKACEGVETVDVSCEDIVSSEKSDVQHCEVNHTGEDSQNNHTEDITTQSFVSVQCSHPVFSQSSGLLLSNTDNEGSTVVVSDLQTIGVSASVNDCSESENSLERKINISEATGKALDISSQFQSFHSENEPQSVIETASQSKTTSTCEEEREDRKEAEETVMVAEEQRNTSLKMQTAGSEDEQTENSESKVSVEVTPALTAVEVDTVQSNAIAVVVTDMDNEPSEKPHSEESRTDIEASAQSHGNSNDESADTSLDLQLAEATRKDYEAKPADCPNQVTETSSAEKDASEDSSLSAVGSADVVASGLSETVNQHVTGGSGSDNAGDGETGDRVEEGKNKIAARCNGSHAPEVEPSATTDSSATIDAYLKLQDGANDVSVAADVGKQLANHVLASGKGDNPEKAEMDGCDSNNDSTI